MVIHCLFFFSSRRRHTRCALVTGVQTCALPISNCTSSPCRPGLALALPNNGTLNSAYALRTSCERGGKIAMSSDGVPGLFHCAPWPYRLFCCSIRNETVARSEEHTSELQSLMRISYAVFCLKKKKIQQNKIYNK